MDGHAERILGQMLSMPRGAVLLRGPATCGKTALCLQLYRRLGDSQDVRAAAVLLAPNRPACAGLREALLKLSGGVLMGARITTFAALAADILAAAGVRGQSVDPLRRQLLLRSVIRRLGAADKLPALAGVLDTPGLCAAVDRAIAELKRAAAEPEALANAPAVTPRTADLVDIYRCYQQALRDSDAYDLEGRMWLARDCLRAGQVPGGTRAVIADGFTDFTPTQLDILQQLSATTLVVVTLPLGDDGRDRMWQWARRTADRVRGQFGDGLREIALPAPPPGALNGLCASLFDPDAACDAPPAPPADAPAPPLSVIAAAGVDAEVAAVARRVKALLLGGAPAGSIAVLARSLDAYREPIERIFAQHDIPIARSPTPLPVAPIARFLLDAAAIPDRDFDCHDVLRTIRNSYFRPSALGPYDARTVAAAESVIRRGNVLAEAQAYRQAAKRLAARIPPPRDEDREDADRESGFDAPTLLAAGEMLGRLFAAARKVADAATLLEFSLTLDLQAAALAHDGDDATEFVARDLAALDTLQQALASLTEPCPAADLRQALTEVNCPAPRGESLVDVMDVIDARAVRWDHVFIVGATQGRFPRMPAEDSLIGEPQRAAWLSAGVPLDARADLAAREMLLFYLACSRADASLTLSYTDCDSAGRSGAPSQFLLSLLAPLGSLDGAGARGLVEHVAPGEFVPPRPASRRDAFNAAVLSVCGPGAAPPAAPGPNVPVSRSAAGAARGLWARQRRWTRGPCDSYDGRITEPDLLERLADHVGRQVFSATQLSSFGQCPWEYFARYILNLRPMEEPARELEPVAAGVFVHAALCDAVASLRGPDGTAAPAQTSPEDLEKALDAAIARQAAKVETERPPYPALWEIQRRRMRSAMLAYLLWARSQPTCGRTVGLEMGFGPMPDQASGDAPPVVVQTPDGPVRTRGRIDRVDSLNVDGQDMLFTIDYKTGRLPSKNDIEEGRNLQLALYVEAVESLLGKPCVGAAFHRVADEPRERLFAALAITRDKPSRLPGLAERRQAARRFIGMHVRAIREGRFDLCPRSCMSYCPYRRICQYSEHRAELKTAAEPNP